MRLVIESELRSVLDLSPNIPQYVAACNAALDDATLTLENDLRTEFALGARVDVFAPNDSEPSMQLKLRAGFLAVSPAPSVMFYSSQGSFSEGSGEDITAGCLIDYEKGLVLVGGVRGGAVAPISIRGGLLVVSYTAGFTPSVADAQVYDPLQVPDWLRVVTLMAARLNLASHPALKVAEVSVDTKALQSQYAAAISRKSRYAPAAILPIA